MTYLDMEIPSRSSHLWRYTPWKRIHPSKVDTVPSCETIIINHEGDCDFKESIRSVNESTDISRVFLHECNDKMSTVEIDGKGQLVHVNLIASGESIVGHIDFQCKGEATIIIHLSGSATWSGLHITGNIERNSSIGYAFVNELDSNSKLLRCEDWNIHRDSRLEYGELSIGGFRNKTDIRTTLSDSNSSLNQTVAVYGVDSRHDDHHMEISHMVKHTDSSLIMNAACGGRSHSIGTGQLFIAKNANNSNAGQVFHNLLLSQDARADAIPELEVLSDDVSAAHGAASAPIDKEQLHYLLSRGLSPEQAEALIVEGFLVNTFSSLKNKIISDDLKTRLKIHLECGIMR
ncbi:MAG: SufD family Fe-S cluster assembly protein [Candidatus Poseidoniaceae archaeon]|nr:SufD family Fe-S cluster assembly protein [Candidatus Poseidoniaceae archaeon]